MQVASMLADAVDGSLRRLARKTPGELVQTGGIGRAKASRLLAALELGQRLLGETRPERARIRSPEDVVQAVAGRLRDLEVEEFHILALSSQHQVLRDVLVTRGTLDGSLVHPREVFRPAIAEAAAGIVLVHNHPSGDPTPSAEDRAVTRQMSAAGQVLGIPVLDHVIVAGDRWISFASQGLL
jgi:DNA repair protein RadC